MFRRLAVPFCLVVFVQHVSSERLANQTVRDILTKNQCLCPCRTNMMGTKSFLVPMEQGNWFEANSYCSSNGMSLVKIYDQQDNQDLKNWLESNGNGPSAIYWIGANDLAKHGLFHWGLTNNRVRYAQWATGEPNSGIINGENEHCVELKATNMQWNDSVCSKRLSYICEHIN